MTDLGIELGKLLYWNHGTHPTPKVCADRDRLKVLGGLLSCFLLGGIAGALGFKLAGYTFTIPIALLLAVMALVPTFDDLHQSDCKR